MRKIDIALAVWTVFGVVCLVGVGLWKAAVGIVVLSLALSALLTAWTVRGRREG